MRISELAETSGVAISAIKYYLREGLLPAGESLQTNQARYGTPHLDRLRLIRALIDVGGLSISGVREVLAALTDDEGGTVALLEATHRAAGRAPSVAPSPGEPAMDEVDRLVRERGWTIREQSASRIQAAQALTTLTEFYAADRSRPTSLLDRYAGMADSLAGAEFEAMAEPGGMTASAGTVVDAVLGEILLCALRRLAWENLANSRAVSG